MERWTNKVALVTGASSGIGAAVSEALTLKGLKVVGLARRLENLKKLEEQWKGHQGKFYPIQCDVRNEDDVLKAFAWVKENLGGVDILVNNAGLVIQQKIIDSDTEDYRKLLETNVLAATICARESVRSMKERQSQGHIVNINSLLGHQASLTSIDLCLYAPSKFALKAISQLLQKEVSDENLDIKVTNLSPGLTKTEIITNIPGGVEMIKHVPALETKDISDAILYVLGTPEHVLISELTIEPVKRLNGLV